MKPEYPDFSPRLPFPFDTTSNWPEQWWGCKKPETLKLVSDEANRTP